MMNEKIKKFIEENIEFIEQNTKESWEEVYRDVSSKWYIVGKFTETLLEANIDPASTLGYIPDFYLIDSSITKYEIPNNVTYIKTNAFRDCSNLTNIIIPNNVISIGNYAFLGCKKLNKVIISESVLFIADEAFRECKKLKEIQYIGTKDQFRNNLKMKDRGWLEYSAIKKVVCTDGVIEL